MTLTRPKTPILVLLALATVIFAAIVAGTIMAQNGTTLSDALQPIDGDEEVVATVQGKDDTRGDIRRAAEFWIVTNMAATSEDATNKSIVLVIDRFIAQAEIERRQLTATRKEAEVFMRRNRDICTGGARCGMSGSCHAPRNQPQRQRVLGKHRTARIRKHVGEIKLSQAIIKEKTWRTPPMKNSSPSKMPYPANCAKTRQSSGTTRTWDERTKVRCSRGWPYSQSRSLSTISLTSSDLRRLVQR